MHVVAERHGHDEGDLNQKLDSQHPLPTKPKKAPHYDQKQTVRDQKTAGSAGVLVIVNLTKFFWCATSTISCYGGTRRQGSSTIEKLFKLKIQG